MPELDETGRMKGRQKGGDRTLEDAFKTMERLTLWLQMAQEQNVWDEVDPLQMAMLYRFLEQIERQIGQLLALGGDDARNALELFKLMGENPRGAVE
jgi:hypothetical protein